jgi:demethylmenaquinone methyltransferase/2-methoxy-6-polyprenyl-1,4-benzoquinol methylase
MFDRIAHRYDLLNHVLSLNRDVAWRKRLANRLPDRQDLRVLDLATGTGDQLIALYNSGKVKSGVGIDLSERMLDVGRRKIRELNLRSQLELHKGDAESIPFEESSFDAVSISFGIRNVTDVARTLGEMRRVLRPGGRALILEFSLPERLPVKWLYLLYFRNILPGFGGLISGDWHAYRYLNQTAETFPYGTAFCRMISAAGFTHVEATPLTLGIATLYQGDK